MWPWSLAFAHKVLSPRKRPAPGVVGPLACGKSKVLIAVGGRDSAGARLGRDPRQSSLQRLASLPSPAGNVFIELWSQAARVRAITMWAWTCRVGAVSQVARRSECCPSDCGRVGYRGLRVGRPPAWHRQAVPTRCGPIRVGHLRSSRHVFIGTRFAQHTARRIPEPSAQQHHLGLACRRQGGGNHANTAAAVGVRENVPWDSPAGNESLPATANQTLPHVRFRQSAAAPR